MPPCSPTLSTHTWILDADANRVGFCCCEVDAVESWWCCGKRSYFELHLELVSIACLSLGLNWLEFKEMRSQRWLLAEDVNLSALEGG